MLLLLWLNVLCLAFKSPRMYIGLHDLRSEDVWVRLEWSAGREIRGCYDFRSPRRFYFHCNYFMFEIVYDEVTYSSLYNEHNPICSLS